MGRYLRCREADGQAWHYYLAATSLNLWPTMTTCPYPLSHELPCVAADGAQHLPQNTYYSQVRHRTVTTVRPPSTWIEHPGRLLHHIGLIPSPPLTYCRLAPIWQL